MKIKKLNAEYIQYLMESIYHFNFSPHFLHYNVHLENFNTERNMHKFYASEQNISMINSCCS